MAATDQFAFMNLPEDENAYNLLELAAFVADAGIFRLGLASYDFANTRDEYIKKLSGIIDKDFINLTKLDLSMSAGEDSLLKLLREHLELHPAPSGKHTAVMVVGIEATIDFRRQLDISQAQGGPLLHNANLQRDAFPRVCPNPVVLWLNPFATTLLPRAAPDLWHWRTGSFNFTGPIENRTSVRQQSLSLSYIYGELPSDDRYRSRLRLLSDLLARLDSAGDRAWPGTLTQRADILHSIGRSEIAWPRLEAGRRKLREALYLYRQLGDRTREATTLVDLANADVRLGETRRAISLLESSLRIAREVGDRRSESLALGSLGRIFTERRQVDRAIDFLEQRLKISLEIGDRLGRAVTLIDLGRAYNEAGLHQQAIDLAFEAITIYRESNDTRGEALALIETGRAYIDLQQADRAIFCFEQALDISSTLSDKYIETIALSCIRLTHNLLGQPFLAKEYTYRRQLSIGKKFNDPWKRGSALCGLGRTMFEQGQYAKSIYYFGDALDIFRNLKDRMAIAVTLINLAESYKANNNMSDATDLLHESLYYCKLDKDASIAKYALRQLEQIANNNDAFFASADIKNQIKSSHRRTRRKPRRPLN